MRKIITISLLSTFIILSACDKYDILKNNAETPADMTMVMDVKKDQDNTPAIVNVPVQDGNKEKRLYIINKNTGRFHYSYCYSVDNMKESNKEYTNFDRNKLISKGYKPCGNCNP